MSRLLLVLGIVLVLFFGTVAGVWWYLFGPNRVQAANLVPATTMVFATIPNGASVVAGYQTSKLKTLVDSPNSQPAMNSLVGLVGQKNLDLLNSFLPNLSGQSFIAVTHFDLDHPEQVGLIAAMKPKAGTADFDAFVAKLKAAWPDALNQAKTGTGTVDGVTYQWMQGPGATDKVCVAQTGGWIVTTWGEAPLRDWLERFQGKATTPSLAQEPDYQKSLTRVGKGAMTLVYFNYHNVIDLLQKQMTKTDPTTGNYLSRKLGSVGGAAMATRFENGEIVDRISLLMPRQAQIDSGASVDPCPFDTLKFTGPGTLLYAGFGMNWKGYFKNLQDQGTPGTPNSLPNPFISGALGYLQGWGQGAGVDVQHNIIDALGSEFSLQVDWDAASTSPDTDIFVKVDKPDDFKPVITAILNSIRQNFGATATVKEHEVNGQHFSTVQFPQSTIFSPTITEDGPYLGIFTTEEAAERAFKRDPATSLTHNADFNRQLGDERAAASQIFFFDSPRLLDRAYQTAKPFLSLASMFNKNLADLINGKKLPADLSWLAPMGTWSFASIPDADGVTGYSVSGVGNQGIFFAGALGGGATMLQTMGMIPKSALAGLYPSVTPPGMTSPMALPSSAPAALPPVADPSAAPVPPHKWVSNLDVPPLVPRSIIYITPDGKIFFEQTPVGQADFADFLKAKKAGNQDLKLIVNVDQNAPADVFSMVMDAGANAGFGVLPYLHTTGKDSFPPPPTPGTVPSSAPDTSTNAAPLAPDASTNAPGAMPSDAATNPVPAVAPMPGANSNSDATPPPPEPPKTP